MVERSAVLSADGRYRYRLDRKWAHRAKKSQGWGRSIAVVMLNPSTADAEVDDATIRKLIGFTKKWGYGRFVVGNLFAVRSRDPKVLVRSRKEMLRGPSSDDRIGPDNDQHLVAMMKECDTVMFAWGAWGSKHWATDRVAQVYRLVPDGTELLQLGESLNSGHPRHPLMPAYKTPYRVHIPIAGS